MGSHTLDFLDFVLGPIRSATGHAANTAGYYPAEDTVTASFRLNQVSWARAHGTSRPRRS